ncbi:MAG: hypothetical protein HRU48_22800 [Vibrio sp.]|uniref:hypothetical protein n=1 Tax=Vibrio sp. TaxID=678 RepID=UPI001EC4BABD|nr:hypothetical protein [Vibrio sp.]NRB70141.1 hypothetical protein [Vibrio sp.]
MRIEGLSSAEKLYEDLESIGKEYSKKEMLKPSFIGVMIGIINGLESFGPLSVIEDELLSDINNLRAKYDHEDLTHAAFVGVLQIFLQKAAGGVSDES